MRTCGRQGASHPRAQQRESKGQEQRISLEYSLSSEIGPKLSRHKPEQPKVTAVGITSLDEATGPL